MNSRRRTLCLLLLIVPCVAHANAGTPLMWVSFLHLFIANAFIGLAEGALLSWWAKAPRVRAQLSMLAANYVSAWAGVFLITAFLKNTVDVNLSNAWNWFWKSIVLMYLATVLLEWPFVALALRKTRSSIGKGLLLNVAVQSITYAILCAIYLNASPTTLLTELEITEPSKMRQTEGGLVYFISAKEGDVESVQLDGSNRKPVLSLRSTNVWETLALKTNGSTWTLCLRGRTDLNSKILVPLATNSSGIVAESPEFIFGSVPSLGGSNRWKYFASVWAAAGITVEDSVTRQWVTFAVETPFIMWQVRNATELPSGQLVFQLGRDQICLFDPETRQIALLARGRGPVVALDASAGTQ